MVCYSYLSAVHTLWELWYVNNSHVLYQLHHLVAVLLNECQLSLLLSVCIHQQWHI